MCDAKRYVRFTPNSDIHCVFSEWIAAQMQFLQFLHFLH
jgi:hypothetical protein